MADYTPTTEQVRETCFLGHYPSPSLTQRKRLGSDFDRWLARVQVEAKAAALEEAAAEWERFEEIGETSCWEITDEQRQEHKDWVTQEEAVWLRARAARLLDVPVSAEPSFIGSIIEVAAKVPGSRVLVLTPRAAAAVLELGSALEAAELGATYSATDWEWKLGNGSKVELGWLNTPGDTWRYGGAEFQLVAFDEVDQYDPCDVMYMASRLRAPGELRQRMDEHGLQLRHVFREANGKMV